MLRHRKVRALIIDEALHLLRFSDYSAIMDTLKSLADIEPTKLILIGTHQIADLMTEYGQVIRRSEIIHYRRYRLSTKVSDQPSSDEAEYILQLQKLQNNWPSRNKPDLVAVWRSGDAAHWVHRHQNPSCSRWWSTAEHAGSAEEATSATPSRPGNLRKIEEETVSKEKLIGCCYGEGLVEEDWFPPHRRSTHHSQPRSSPCLNSTPPPPGRVSITTKPTLLQPRRASGLALKSTCTACCCASPMHITSRVSKLVNVTMAGDQSMP
jgi:hypothetical protein